MLLKSARQASRPAPWAAPAPRRAPSLAHHSWRPMRLEPFTLGVTNRALNVGGIGLQVSSNANAAGGLQLTTSGAVSSTPGLDVTIALSLADLNAMKLKGVGSARSQSYLTMHMSSTVLSDMTGVAVNVIVNGVDAFSASGILADGTSPVLSSFDLSINSSEAILRFSRKL